MSTAEFIPRSDEERAREQFESTGHVGLSGLYDATLAPAALAEARQQFLRWRNRGPGESVARLRFDPARQKALAVIIEGMREGAVLLGHSLVPGTGEAAQFDIIDMGRGAKGPAHTDNGAFIDVVAATNLQGPSTLWFEGEGDGATYALEPGMVVIHDLAKGLLHQGAAGADESRIGLAVARRDR
ncbi:MAG TPA: hypothetical protein VFX84_02655 [Candidatus Saccharimonadales bacterium]|nr:hypothetical protein [Candidatus Saccharimonadales bacterium]